jgi:hypothetical protein
MNQEFDPHLTLDLKDCPKEILQDYKLHFDLLKKLPELIGMTQSHNHTFFLTLD